MLVSNDESIKLATSGIVDLKDSTDNIKHLPVIFHQVFNGFEESILTPHSKLMTSVQADVADFVVVQLFTRRFTRHRVQLQEQITSGSTVQRYAYYEHAAITSGFFSLKWTLLTNINV